MTKNPQARSQPEIKLIVNDYAQVSGLSRYATALYRHLKQQTDATITPVPLTSTPLPKPLLLLASRLGYDLETFLSTYPLSWPCDTGDLVHLTHRAQATLLLRKPRGPTVVTVHDIIHYQYRHDPSMLISRNRFVQWVDEASIRALQNADAVIASSNYTKRALIEDIGLPEAKIHCIHLGVDPEQFHPCQIPQSFLERYSLGADLPYILHISTEEPRKNLLALLRAFSLVKSQQPDIRLLKVGAPFYPKVRSRALALVDELDLGDSVLFIDNIPDADLRYFYNLARVFAFPSYAEGFGLPVLEAMACGTPVVCSDMASLPEVVGDAALMVGPDDTRGLAQALSTLLTDKQLWTELRDSGLKHATQLSWARTAMQTLHVYDSILGTTLTQEAAASC